MPRQSISNRRAKSANKSQKIAKTDPQATAIAKKLSLQYSKAKPSKALLAITTVRIIRARLFYDFIQLAKASPELKPLIDNLPYLGFRSLDEFLDSIGLEKLLRTNYDPKGTIYEVLILNDPKMIEILNDRAKGTIINLSFMNKNQMDKAVINIAKNSFILANFENKDVLKATNFKTFPGNKLFSDFSMVQYDESTKSLLIIIPGEIKEPSVAKKLKKQIANFFRRLKSAVKLQFDLGNETKEVLSQNVYVVRDNAVGLARRIKKLPVQNMGQTQFNLARGKNISVKSPVMEIINANFRDAIPIKNASQNRQEFLRLLVTINPEVDPKRITNALKKIKREVLKNLPK